MKFSLIVVTTERLHLVERLFASLVAQTHANFEVILVHGQACAAKARSLVAEYAARLDIRTLISADTCLSRSRNAALPLVNGDVVAFPDDDCVYEAHTLEQADAVFSAMPRLHTLVGSWTGLNAMWPEHIKDIQPLQWHGAFFRAETYVQFYRREAIRRVGDFDVELGPGTGLPYGCGEDTDYLLRALRAGCIACRADRVRVRHPEANPRDAALRGKVTAYARGRMRLLDKHRLPLWFVLANVAFPLLIMPVECVRQCADIARYRCAMFMARLKGLTV